MALSTGGVADVVEKSIPAFGERTAQIVVTQSAATVLEGYCGIATLSASLQKFSRQPTSREIWSKI